MNIKKVWFFVGVVVAFGPMAFVLYQSYDTQSKLKNYLDIVIEEKDKSGVALKKAVGSLDEIVQTSSKSNVWLNVQKKAKDTVVQIFTEVSMFNWLEPYKTPFQSKSFGTGFFISADGDIITNYHVVSQFSSLQIQLPSFGRKRFDVDIVGVCPDKDTALLRLKKDALKFIKDKLGKISYLEFGNSDAIVRTQEILALGYPLAQERLKSTLGVVSGREQSGLIQITAALNPGNSGGPSLNSSGKVIGINSSAVLDAQNIGYIIPINEVKGAVKDLYKIKLLRKPTLGCIFTVATEGMVDYLGNPSGGGWYVAKVFEKSLLKKVGIEGGDMLYEVNSYKLDMYGEMSVPWNEDKISFIDFLNRFGVGDDIHFVVYRKGKRKDFNFKLEVSFIPPVRRMYVEFEKIDYEIVGGLVVMPLTINHITRLIEHVPSLVKYIRAEEQQKPALIITHILPNSQAMKVRVLRPGAILEEVNGKKVKTIKEFRSAVKESKKSGFLTISTEDKMFGVLPVKDIVRDSDGLAARYFYKKSELLKVII